MPPYFINILWNHYTSELYQNVKIHEHSRKFGRKDIIPYSINRENAIINIVYREISIFGECYFKTICHDHHC